MKNIRKGLFTVFLALFVVMSTVLPAASVAGTTAVRSLSAEEVAAGDQFSVTVAASNYGPLGQVVETLPAGFEYVSQTGAFYAAEDGNEVTFTLAGSTSFTYNVVATSDAGTYDFVGTIEDSDNEVSAVSGTPSVTVVAGGSGGTGDDVIVDGVLVERTLPAIVTPGEEFTVTVVASNYGPLGQVVETLPAGFDYVSQAGAFHAAEDGNEVTFTLAGSTSFTYNVIAASGEGTYNFVGTIEDSENEVSAVIGDNSVIVDADGVVEYIAVRALPENVAPGEEFTVEMDLEDFGPLGQIIETLPAGFEYVSQTGAFNAAVDGNEVTFTVMESSSFTYNVTAAAGVGAYDFAGTIEDSNHAISNVGGDTEVVVGDDVVVGPVVPEGIVINDGWNFISVPYALDNSNVEFVLADINYTTLMYWDGAQWIIPTEFEPLKAYWIQSNEGVEQMVSGDVLEPLAQSVPPTMTVHPGWNAIGYTDSTAILSAEMVLESIDDSYTLVKGPYDSATMTYGQIGHNGEIGVIAGSHVGTDVFDMGPYEGFWVYVTQEDTLVGF